MKQIVFSVQTIFLFLNKNASQHFCKSAVTFLDFREQLFHVLAYLSAVPSDLRWVDPSNSS